MGFLLKAVTVPYGKTIGTFDIIGAVNDGRFGESGESNDSGKSSEEYDDLEQLTISSIQYLNCNGTKV